MTLRNLATASEPVLHARGYSPHTQGHLHEYLCKVSELRSKNLSKSVAQLGSADRCSSAYFDFMKLVQYCTLGQGAAYAGRELVADVLHGGEGKLLQRSLPKVKYDSTEQRRRAWGYVSKLQAIVHDVHTMLRLRPQHKVLIICHRMHGYRLLLRMVARRLGSATVRGFPPARTYAERCDADFKRLAGLPCEAGFGAGTCSCALCTYNRPGGAARVMVADAKECTEGISFLGVRTLILADVPPDAHSYMQRIGRAVRFMGHACYEASADRNVDVRLYVAQLPVNRYAYEKSADAILLARLRTDLATYAAALGALRGRAIDTDCWVEDEPPTARGASNGASNGNDAPHTPSKDQAEDVRSEASDDEALPSWRQSSWSGEPPPGGQPEGSSAKSRKHSKNAPPPPPPRPPPQQPPPPRSQAVPPSPPRPPPPYTSRTSQGTVAMLIVNIIRAHKTMYASERMRLVAMLSSIGCAIAGDDASFRKAWRRASLLIHPDKCMEPRGEDALKLLNNCYNMCFGGNL